MIGYRGTGKSTVGRILADRLNRTFLDADLEIEARAGRSISAIFTEEGEPVFRDWEERTLAELTRAIPTAVIATGGGAVLREANRRRLRDFGFVVWLTAEPAELARRLEADPRGAGRAARPDPARDHRRNRAGPRGSHTALPGAGRRRHRDRRQDPDQVADAILELLDRP